MPKTYNTRMIRDLEIEAKHAPPIPNEPDVTPYIRFFPTDEIAALVARIEKRVAAGMVTHLSPETARLAAAALRGYNAKPDRNAIARECCGVGGGCEPPCVACIGKANAIMKLYAGTGEPRPVTGKPKRKR